MKFYKFLSVILHPIVIPTIGVFVYFFLIRNSFNSDQRLAVLGLVFITTYIIPLLILVLFKSLKMIDSYYAESIRERKIPIAMMIILFYLLGYTLLGTANITDLGILFYATSLGLTIIYIFFAFKLKVSIHLLSLGISTGFFLMMSSKYHHSFTLVVIICFLLSGFLGSARLHLKAHTKTEVYLGFLFGYISPFIVNYVL